METMWTIARYNHQRHGELTLAHNGMVWVNKMTAIRHYNMMRPVAQKNCCIVEVPASVKDNKHLLYTFLRQDEETRKEILEG